MSPKTMRISMLVLLAVSITLAIFNREQLDSTALQQWVQDAGFAGPLVFVLIYAIGTVLFLPGSVLTLAGGALFGPVLGTICNLTGATLGATMALLIARYIASEWVEQKSGGRLQQLKQGIESEGWRFIAFVRLVPLFPFNVLNYALGLTRIKLWHFVITSYVCMLPGAIAYTYLGYAGREAVAGSEGLIHTGLLAVALLTVATFIPHWIKRLRRSSDISVQTLKSWLDRHENVLILDVRTVDEYGGEQGHIAGSSNIPMETLSERIDEYVIMKDRPIAIICRTDKRSIKAEHQLLEKGFTNTHVVKGGMMQWHRLAYPINHDQK